LFSLNLEQMDPQCLLVHPDGKREYVRVSTKSRLGTINSDFDCLVKSRNNCSGFGSQGPFLPKDKSFVLVLYYTTSDTTPINREVTELLGHIECECGHQEHHSYHGIMGVSKHIEKVQVDISDDDFDKV